MRPVGSAADLERRRRRAGCGLAGRPFAVDGGTDGGRGGERGVAVTGDLAS